MSPTAAPGPVKAGTRRAWIALTVTGTVLLMTGVLTAAAGEALAPGSERGTPPATVAGGFLAVCGLLCGVGLLVAAAAGQPVARRRPGTSRPSIRPAVSKAAALSKAAAIRKPGKPGKLGRLRAPGQQQDAARQGIIVSQGKPGSPGETSQAAAPGAPGSAGHQPPGGTARGPFEPASPGPGPAEAASPAPEPARPASPAPEPYAAGDPDLGGEETSEEWLRSLRPGGPPRQ